MTHCQKVKILFDKRAKKEFKKLPKNVKKYFWGLIDYLEQEIVLLMPHSKKLGGHKSLHELRVKHQGHWRAIYTKVVKKEKAVVLLLFFKKETNNIPLKHIKTALKRKKKYAN